MNKNLKRLFCVAVVAALGAASNVRAQLPPDFPLVSLAPNTNPAPGWLFGSLVVSNVPGYSNYFAILDNATNPVLLSKTDSLGKPACNGLFVTPSGQSGQPTTFLLKDASFSVIATLGAGNGYLADSRDVQVLPNGHALIVCRDDTTVMDMSQIVPGGSPAAQVVQAVIQEVDVDGKVVFQWRSLDHIPVTDSYLDLTGQRLDYIQVNSVWFDDTDGTLILSCRNTSEIIKISRVTGDILWRLQGRHNQFTFTNGIVGSTNPAVFQVQHCARRLPNGNLTVFDNGCSQQLDPQYGFTRPYSRGVEYVLNEATKTARLVWEYRHSPDIIAYDGGSLERLPGGHSIIQWGTANTANPALAMTEADTGGQLVCDAALLQAGVTGNFTRVVWPLETNYINVIKRELLSGNTYVFTDGTNVTGVALDVTSLNADVYNNLTVSRQSFAPVLPRFMDRAPRVEPTRMVLTANFINSITADLSFDVDALGLKDPANTIVYYRQTPGDGLFVGLPTAYDGGTHRLHAAMSDFGEFIFGYPDLAEVPYAPILITPAADAAVNQSLPVSFLWTPRGFAEAYHLQVSTNADFATLVVDAPDLTESRYTNLTVAANTRYYWRVNTWTYGGESVWATNSFITVPPMASVTVATIPSGITIRVDGTNFTAPAFFNWLPGSSHTLEAASPQLSGDGHARYLFASWSDAGAQTHSVTAPSTPTNYTASFSTQYLLETTVSPAGAGSVSNYPAGPWYDAGQAVSLTALANSGYRFNFWQGVDSAVTNTAQVTMNAYRLAQASFQASIYPYIVVTNRGGTAPGNLIGNIAGRNADGTRTHYVILDNTGTNALFASTNNTLHRFVTPQGFDAVGGGGVYSFKDETISVVGTVATLGYTLDVHDVKLWPNGHTLVFGTEVRTFDMSAVVPNGKTAASVTGNVVQELDADKRLVFEWHTFDHIAITNTFADMTQSSFDYAHINAMTLDPTDNNLLLSLRTTSEIVKVNRRTGQIIWRLGGKMNQFTFINEHPENAPFYTVGQHDVHRLANGNLLYFDNGNISGGGVTPSDRTYSRMVEYALDETNMTATLVWDYRHTPDISAGCTGSLKRFANGNTLIDWGCAVPSSGTIITEVNPAGEVVFEMKHRTNSGVGSVLLGGGLTKQVWNSPDLVRSATYLGIQTNQTYTAAAAGVAVTINSLSGPADNALVIERHLDAVRYPNFADKAPQVVMEHVVLSGSNIVGLAAELSLSLPDTSYVFDTPRIHDPAQLTVYHRPIPGQGQFLALPTTYDPGTQKLRVITGLLGEFIFAYPDVAETPFVPVVLSPVDQTEVNQAQPVQLVWVPQGLVASFDLQVATDAGFANLLLDTNGLGSSSFAFQNPPPNTTLFWRVRTVNQGGTSEWASASFTTVPPVLYLTYPAGGEVWQRFQVVTIRWVDNLAENVALDLYQGGVSNRNFAANIPSSGSYTWAVGQYSPIPPGTNYTIKIRSTTNPALYDFSEPFAIITNLTSVTIATAPNNLALTVDGTNYTAPAVFAWLPRTSHTIATASPQVASDGHSRSVFAAWSDGGDLSHSITVPFSPVTNTANFFTNFLLEVTATPPDAGAVAAAPTGPWYDAGQLVSLTANPNPGNLLYAWQGVDSQAGNTAQVTMNSYKAVQANFMPASGVPLIDANSFVRLPDGRVRFSLTAGAGVVTQATVWRATALSPLSWQIAGTVPLNNGSGVFIEDPASTAATGFYRVSVP